MFSTKQTDPVERPTETCYHSILHLLDLKDLLQAPPDFWQGKDVIEVPSTRNTLSRRRMFPSYTNGYQRNQELRKRRAQRDRKHQDVEWWGTYGALVNRSREELDDIQHTLICAASLHNRVLSFQDSVGDNRPRGTGSRSQEEDIAVLKKELHVLLAAVVAYPLSRKTST